MYQKIKGTNDYYGLSALKKAFVEKEFSELCLLHNFSEMITPIFENTNVFVRSSGEGSDIVNKEMYSFIDKGENHLTLRPEGTASVVRSFIENKLYTKPGLSKFFYYGPMFRYERPQLGRTRQFYQFGVEIFGEVSSNIDAYTIALAANLFEKVGLKDYYEVVVNTIGDLESRTNYKLALVEYFSKYQNILCPDCLRRLEKNPLRILDCKVCYKLEEFQNAPKITDYLNQDSINYFNNVIKVLDELNINYEINHNLVRGLDYYTDTVFEFFINDNSDSNIKNLAIGAGGRYSTLVKEFGGPDIPGIGFGLGVERIVLAMENYSLFKDLEIKTDIVLIGLDELSKIQCMKIGNELINNNITYEMDYKNYNLKPQFKLCDRLNPTFIGLIGEDERKSGVINIKYNNTQETVKINELVKFIKENKKNENA